MSASHQNVVAIETATETVGVAVRTAAGVEADFTLTGRRRHVETLTPALEHLLEQVGLAPRDIHVVAVDIGPGLFTGLRVGVAAAKGLAQSLGLGVIAMTSLEILTAAAGRAALRGIVLSCVDARRGEVFASASELNASGTVTAELVTPGLFTPSQLAEVLGSLGGRPVHAVGDGALRYAEILSRCRRPRRGSALPVVPPAGDADRPGPRADGRGATAGRPGVRRSPLSA